jgi:hypothetical protein
MIIYNPNMGNSTSTTDVQPLEMFYERAIGKHFTSGISGGDESCGCTLGGYTSLEEYGNSAYSEAKEKLIRGIAEDVSSMLKVKSGFAKTADIKDVVAKLMSMVPNPKDKKKHVKNDSSAHIELCKKFASSINKQYDMEIIDKSASPNEVCNKVSEIIYSLFSGLHTEFLTISGDVERTVRNLQTLQEFVDSANKKLMSKLDSEDTEAASIAELYNKVTEEIKRQQTILANLTSAVIGPVGNSLITILEDNDDFVGLTKDIEKSTGTTEFSSKLGYLLSGTANIAHAAELVDKALKTIGMTVREYKDVHGLKELREKVYETIVAKKPTSGELYKLLAAADALYKIDLDHDDIIKHLEKKGGSALNEFETSWADDSALNTELGDKSNDVFKGRIQSNRKSIVKQLEKKALLRKQIFHGFNIQIKEKYNKIKYLLGLVGKKIGSEIPLSSELDAFIKQLDIFADNQPERKNIHIALSGYPKDIGSAYVKYTFMESLEAISESLGALLGGKGGELFKDIKASIDSLVNLVKEFNTTFTNALSDISVDSLEKKNTTGGDCGCGGDPDEEAVKESEEMEGGSEYSSITALGGLTTLLPESDFDHFKSIKRSISEIDYFYRIAGVKKNMQIVSTEFASNTENYENIIGEEGGYIIDQIQTKYNNLIEALEPTTGGVPLPADLYKGGFTNDVGALTPLLNDTISANVDAAGLTPADKVTMEDYKGGYKFLLEYIRSSKIEMLEAVQALDLYLSKFTESIQLKPDQIKEFSQILEQLEVVAKWFTDKSGDALVGVFESFSNQDNGPGVPNFAALRNNNTVGIRNPLTGNWTVPAPHYYANAATATPGKFYLSRMMTRENAIEFIKQIEKSIKSVRALENVISTFSRVNTNVSADVRTFMSSGQMFKAFMKYSIASSISVGYLNINGKCKIPDEDATTIYTTIHKKMAVGLQFNKRVIKLNDTVKLALLDPLAIIEKDATVDDCNTEDICDKLFQLAVKSMITKVFVVVGSYTLFNKPAKDQTDSLSLAINPLRQIMGGARHVDIIEDATELYTRLPLIVEWFRKVFEFKNVNINIIPPVPAPGNQGVSPIISMIPDMDSIWGDICKVIFLDAINIEDGAYPSEFADRIISAVNDIYKHYKAKKSDISCREILMEFVIEVNRRYGFIMREEINAYLEEKQKYITVDETYPDDDNVDFDILDVEAQMGRRAAPSDRFRTFRQKKTTRKFTTNGLLQTVKRFRDSIKVNLDLNAPPAAALAAPGAANYRNNAEVSLNGIIELTKKKIHASNSADDKYKIIHEQLHGVSKYGDLDQQQIILFHETVITPLTVLYYISEILNDFNRFCVSLGNVAAAPFDAVTIRDKALLTFKGKPASNKFHSAAVDEQLAGAAGLAAAALPAAGAIGKHVFTTPEYNTYLLAAGAGFSGKTLEDLLRKLTNIGCDMNGLTEVSFVGSGSETMYPMFEYSKLEETCSELFNNAKAAFHQLRRFLPNNLVQQVEQLETAPGTLNNINMFYIQENLFERLFSGKYGNGLTDANIGLKNIWNKLSVPNVEYTNGAAIQDIWAKLTYWGPRAAVDLRDIAAIGSGPLEFPEYYTPMFTSGAVLGMPTTKNESILTTAILTGKTRAAGAAFVAPAGAGYTDPANTNLLKNDQYLGISGVYDYDDKFTMARHSEYGLVVKFNQLLYKYFSTLIDKSTKKIYITLIEKFVNGHNAKEILSGAGIDDYGVAAAAAVPAAVPTTNVLNAAPPANAVIFKSLADTIKAIMTVKADKNFGTISSFLEENLMNVASYQKEIMRANLPAFEKEFAILAKKATFLRQCLEETKFKVVANKSDLIGILDDLTMSSKSIIRCITDVQKELNDVPMYFETYSDSIVDYQNQNGRLPFMPVSNITHLMNFRKFNTAAAEYKLSIIPQKSTTIGSPEFKFMYGTRGLLSHDQKPSMEFAPWVSSLLESYNGKVGGGSVFDKTRMGDITKDVVGLSRWVIDYMYHKQVLCNHNWNAISAYTPLIGIKNLSCQTGMSVVPAPIAPAVAFAAIPEFAKFSTQNILISVENDNYRQSVFGLVECIGRGNNTFAGLDRKNFRIYNILDLNIVPINVHAIQREIPFINIFNYAYTFDQIMERFILGDVGTPEGVLKKILKNPLETRLLSDYNNIYRIMTGATSMLGRPKYLSDQLWNKVLLNTLYTGANVDQELKHIMVGLVVPVVDEPFTRGITLVRQPVSSNPLHYVNSDGAIVRADVAITTAIATVPYEGYLRYNSKLVGFIEWFAHLQRILRMLMRKQLEWVSDPVVHDNDAIAEEVTEFKSGELVITDF